MFKRVRSLIHKEASPQSQTSSAQPDIKAYIELLNPDMQVFASFFYQKFKQLLPTQFCFDWDRNAPKNPNLTGKNSKTQTNALSLELQLNRRGVRLKFGTGRVELRNKHYFVKTVTWKTPKHFLHHMEIYQLIKTYYYDCSIVKNRSKTRRGFTIKNANQVMTLEVFGDNVTNGYLACDLTLSRFNQPLAQQRLSRFMDFYATLYNHLGNDELKFTVQPLSNVEFPDLLDA